MKPSLELYRKSKFIRNTLTLISATGIAQAISLAVYPVLTRIYTPAEHGLFSLFLSVITITGIISTGKYELAIMIPREREKGAGLTVLGMLISLAFSLLLLVVTLLFHKSIPTWLGNEYMSGWIWFIPLSTFLVAVFQCLSYWFNREGDYKGIAAANLGQSVINSAVKLSASRFLLHGGGLMTGAITGQIFGVVIYGWRLIRGSKLNNVTGQTNFLQGAGEFFAVKWADLKSLAREYSSFPKFSMMHKLINNFSSSLPVFVFSHYFTADIVGFFGLGFMLINRPMNLLSTSFTKVFSQRIIDMHNGGKPIFREVWQFVLRMVAIGVVPFAVIALFGPWLVSFIFGENWYEAGIYMRILSPWLFVVFISAPITFISDMVFRQQAAMWIEVVKFALRIGALAVGVIYKDVYLSLVLFSGFSFVVVAFNLWWCLKLARVADEQSISE